MSTRVSRLHESPGAAGPLLKAVPDDADLLATLNPVTGDAPGWRDLAACQEYDGDFWFPEKGESTRTAKIVCGTCPSRAPCLTYALETDQKFGVWGALSAEERRKLLGKRPRCAA